MLSKKTKILLDQLSGWFGSWFSVDMGIDLGTCSTLVCARGKGVVLNEPSVVAVSSGTKVVVSGGEGIGTLAHEMLGRTPESISTIRPLKGGVISDFEMTEVMLHYFIKKVHSGRKAGFARPRVVIAVPSRITAVERLAVVDSAHRAGARKVYLLDEPIAAGIGSGLPVTSPTASMIVDIGGGTTEVAIISLADIAACRSIRLGGDDMDEAITNHIKRTYNLLIGETSAERVKKQIGSAAPLQEELTMEVAGRDTISGLPRKVLVTSEEIRQALRECIAEIIDVVGKTLEKVRPELAADLVDNGIHICGGGSLLRELDSVLATATGLKVQRVEEPLSCVVRGTSVYLESLDLWKHTLDQSDYGWD